MDTTINDICQHPIDTENHTSLNRIADYFRMGGDRDQLIPMLLHSNEDVISSGLWVLSEVENANCSIELSHILLKLIEHINPIIRMYAGSSLAESLPSLGANYVARWIPLLWDSNEGVKTRALMSVRYLDDVSIRKLSTTHMAKEALALSRNTEPKEICTAVLSTDSATRSIAIAAAIRSHSHDKSLMNQIHLALQDIDPTDARIFWNVARLYGS